MPKIIYNTHDNKTHSIEVQNGLTVMEGAVQNDIPGIDSTDEGTWRRICVIPYISKFVDKNSPTLNDPVKFPNHFPKDAGLKEKLATWRPYFLFMLWQRYLNLKRTNFNALSEINRPDAVNSATQEYKKNSNVYEQYFLERLENKVGFRVNINEVYNDFRDYVKENSMERPASKKEFEMHMKRFVDLATEGVFILEMKMS